MTSFAARAARPVQIIAACWLLSLAGLQAGVVGRYQRSCGWRHHALMDILPGFRIQLLVQLVAEVIGDFLLEAAFQGVAAIAGGVALAFQPAA